MAWVLAPPTGIYSVYGNTLPPNGWKLICGGRKVVSWGSTNTYRVGPSHAWRPAVRLMGGFCLFFGFGEWLAVFDSLFDWIPLRPSVNSRIWKLNFINLDSFLASGRGCRILVRRLLFSDSILYVMLRCRFRAVAKMWAKYSPGKKTLIRIFDFWSGWILELVHNSANVKRWNIRVGHITENTNNTTRGPRVVFVTQC